MTTPYEKQCFQHFIQPADRAFLTFKSFPTGRKISRPLSSHKQAMEVANGELTIYSMGLLINSFTLTQECAK